MPTEWDVPPEPVDWDITIPTDDTSIARRRRALAPIQVLTDIERTKTSLDGDFWHRYDLFTIALAVIDQVALAMGISAGKTWDEAVDYAKSQAARQAPDADDSQWAGVAERVVVSLVTTDIETVPYVTYSAAGPQWRAQRFRLLYVHAGGGDATEYLRASEQAINIFIDALDLDIEAAQIATEAQLTALIARGAIESAVQIARYARYQSIQYQERIRRIIADTLIDPDTHDWVDEVPALLDAALLHVQDRLAGESSLLEAVAERRFELDDRAKVQAANMLIEILRECRHRHDELHRHLIGARTRLREALDDRFVRAPRSTHRSDLGRDLLNPYLTAPTQTAAVLADRLVAVVGGLSARWLPSLAVLTDELCAPARVPEPGEQFEPPEFDDDDVPEWWEIYEDTVEAILEAIDEPIRLSQLLARADELASHVSDDDGKPLEPDLLTAALVHGAHRAWAARLAGRSAGDRMLLAVDTGDRLTTDLLRTADLLLMPGWVTTDIEEAAARPIEVPDTAEAA
ncbi:hypothetical protein ACQPZJ_38015 [Actinoplanes sp. CA-054009]